MTGKERYSKVTPRPKEIAVEAAPLLTAQQREQDAPPPPCRVLSLLGGLGL
jgi:hypothetical protein